MSSKPSPKPSAKFETAAADAQNLKSTPSDDDLLELYGLYKQVTAGDNDTNKPGIFDLRGKYKWQAWMDVKGTPHAEAEEKYIALVEKLKTKHGF